MNTELETNDQPTGYLLLIRGTDWDKGLTLEQMQEVVDRTTAWFDELFNAGKVKGGGALGLTGNHVTGSRRAVTDGPFAESKESIGGYLLLDAASLEEATAIAQTSPGLDYGISIEVRPVMNECQIFKRVKERLGLAAA